MTMFSQKSFSVGAPGTQEYRDNWERTFRNADRQNEELHVDSKEPSAVREGELPRAEAGQAGEDAHSGVLSSREVVTGPVQDRDEAPGDR